jgi:hypothetical protein
MIGYVFKNLYHRKRLQSQDILVDSQGANQTCSVAKPQRKWPREMATLLGGVAVVGFMVLLFDIIRQLSDIKPEAYGGVSVAHPYFILNRGKITQKNLSEHGVGSHEHALSRIPCERVSIAATNEGVYEQRRWGGEETSRDDVTMYMITNVFDALRAMSMANRQRCSIPKMINFTQAECAYGIHEGHVPRSPLLSPRAYVGEVGGNGTARRDAVHSQKPPYAPNMCVLYAFLSADEFLMVNPVVVPFGDVKKTVVMTDGRFGRESVIKSYAESISVVFVDWKTKTSVSARFSGAESYLFQVEYDLMVNGGTIYDGGGEKR